MSLLAISLIDQAGDMEAFTTLVQRHEGRVFRLLLRMTGSREEAEDVAQETFISAHRAIGGFRGGSLRAWLLRIASNLSYDAIRSKKRRPADSLEESMESPSFSVPSKDPGPEQLALQSELQETIQEAIMGLPTYQRAVLVFVDVQGMSYDETAEAIGKSIGTVKSRLSRARARVRDALMEHRELLPDQFRQV